MGLLNRAIAVNNAKRADTKSASEDIQSFIAGYSRKNPLFHCIVLQDKVQDIPGMMEGHGAACIYAPGDKCLVLLPGPQDRELFAHRLSKSAGSAILCQISSHSASDALNTLNPYLR